MNVIDSVRFEFLRSELKTLRKTFPYVRVVAAEGDWPPAPNNRATYVLVAGLQPPPSDLEGAVPEDEVDAFVRDGHGVVLTDDHAPVDQLLAPTFSQALRGR